MAVNEELVGFVREALSRKVPRTEIEQVLLRAGWTSEQTRGALAAFADLDFPVPVPRATPYLSAREAFLYLVLFGTLYASAYYVCSLIFDFINLVIPDPAMSGEGYELSVRRDIRWAVSMLIVAFPVFLFMSWLTGRAVRVDPIKRASKVRRWLMYLTLLIAASALIGDVATLVYNVLGGEATVRFLLKVVTVALVAGTAFTYYLRDLRLDEQEARG